MPADHTAQVALLHREMAPETEPEAPKLPDRETHTCEAAAAASLASAVRACQSAAANLSTPAPHSAQCGAHAQHERASCQGELLEAGVRLRVVLAATQGPASEQLAPALVRFGGALVRWHGLTSAGAPEPGAGRNPVRALLEALTSACRLGLTSSVLEAIDAITACAGISSGEGGQLVFEGVTSTWEDPAAARGCPPSAAPFAASAPGSAARCAPWRAAHASQQDASFSRQLERFRRCAAAGAEAARAAAAAATVSVDCAAPPGLPAASAAAAGPEAAGAHVQRAHAADSHGPTAAPAWRLGHADSGIHARVPADAPLRSLGHSSDRPHLPTQACRFEVFIGALHMLSICPPSCIFPCRTCLPRCMICCPSCLATPSASHNRNDGLDMYMRCQLR